MKTYNCPKCNVNLIKSDIHNMYSCNNERCHRFYLEFSVNPEFSKLFFSSNNREIHDYYFSVEIKTDKVITYFYCKLIESKDIIENNIKLLINENFSDSIESVEDVIQCYKIIDNYICKFIKNILFM